MKKIFLVAIMLLISIVSFAQKIPQDQIVGIWKSEDYKIEIFKSDETYSGKLLWSKDMFETDGKTSKKDSKNPNVKLRSRNVQGITHITGLKFKDNEFEDGKLYSFNDGNNYNFKATLKGINSLETRGYKGISIIGKTVKWMRVK